MKEVILLLLVLNVVFSSALFLSQRLKRSPDNEFNSSLNSPNVPVWKSHFFAQKLDHFNPADDRKWNQRYWISQKYFGKGGTALLVSNGAWLVEYADGELDGDPVIELFAKELKAVIFSIEHRFYGRSWPAKENKRYLSSKQAVSDIANFIKGVTEIFKLPKDTKWIVIGCSYGGMLTTWARLKYPHLIHGAVVSSAPILANIDYYSKSCPMKSVVYIFLNNNSLCEDNIKNTADLATILHNDMVEILSAAVRGNDPTSPINIPSVCELMMNDNLTKLEIFNELRKRYATYTKTFEDYSSNLDAELWSYQECSEFGFFSSYYKNSSLFILSQMIPIESEVKKKCGKFYGPNFGTKELSEKVNQTNLLYGGLDIDIGNIVFIHGSLDPWYGDGFYQKKDGALYETIFVNGTSHCSDLIHSDTDPPELKNARVKVLNTMKDWLQK